MNVSGETIFVIQVSELRDELEARNMNSKGLRLQLLARLSKVLKTEQDTAEQEEKNVTKAAVDKEKEKEEEKKWKQVSYVFLCL